jgi:hypothetical protein
VVEEAEEVGANGRTGETGDEGRTGGTGDEEGFSPAELMISRSEPTEMSLYHLNQPICNDQLRIASTMCSESPS